MAKQETAWITELFEHFIWKFLYVGLCLARLLLLIVSFPAVVESLYKPDGGSSSLNTTNALSSFWRPIPVNWATTIDLNPSALLPSACIPHIPKTDLKDKLKIYGDAEDTVSELRAKVELVTEGRRLLGTFLALNVISVELIFSFTTYCPLYPTAVTPWTLNGVSTSNPSISLSNFTLITEVPVSPSPDLMLLIPDDPPVDPTIRYSSIFFWISISSLGYSGTILLPEEFP